MSGGGWGGVETLRRYWHWYCVRGNLHTCVPTPQTETANGRTEGAELRVSARGASLLVRAFGALRPTCSVARNSVPSTCRGRWGVNPAIRLSGG